MRLSCFVIIGYGIKVDYETGRQLNLDRSYENLIKPVFDELGIYCYRAIDKKHSGTIDEHMYEGLLNADIVVADISTLNPNALYELGVRHALRPYSTIVISENKLKYPFDINHTVIEPYEHLGSDIGYTETLRFRKELKEKVIAVLEQNRKDSPVYTYISNLIPPKKDSGNQLQIDDEKIDRSLSQILIEAETYKSECDYNRAIESLKLALEIDCNNEFILQRLALNTYKSEQPDKITALVEAIRILKPLNPEKTTNTETLGLMGAINKRLFETTNEARYLERSIYYYNKGYVIKNDYYNGINLSYLYSLRASIQNDKELIIADHINAKRIRSRVINICEELIDSQSVERGDLVWINLTLSEAYLGNGFLEAADKYLAKAIENKCRDFELDSFNQQISKLKEILVNIESKLKEL